MPYLGLGLHVAIALFFAVHAVRSQQNTYWLFILFSFPGLGSIVYFFAIYLPEMRHSRGFRTTAKAASRLIDPNQAVRKAREDLEHAPTIQHRMRLADLLLDAGQAAEACEQYQQAANGPFSDDPDLLKGLARAQFAIGDAAGAKGALEKLFVVQPSAKEQSGPTLLYARVLAQIGSEQAREAFAQAVTYGTDAAARCLYADWLVQQNNEADRKQAHTLYSDVLQDAKHGPRYARQHNRDWIDRAKTGLAEMAQR